MTGSAAAPPRTKRLPTGTGLWSCPHLPPAALPGLLSPGEWRGGLQEPPAGGCPTRHTVVTEDGRSPGPCGGVRGCLGQQGAAGGRPGSAPQTAAKGAGPSACKLARVQSPLRPGPRLSARPFHGPGGLGTGIGGRGGLRVHGGGSHATRPIRVLLLVLGGRRAVLPWRREQEGIAPSELLGPGWGGQGVTSFPCAPPLRAPLPALRPSTGGEGWGRGRGGQPSRTRRCAPAYPLPEPPRQAAGDQVGTGSADREQHRHPARLRKFPGSAVGRCPGDLRGPGLTLGPAPPPPRLLGAPAPPPRAGPRPTTAKASRSAPGSRGPG